MPKSITLKKSAQNSPTYGGDVNVGGVLQRLRTERGLSLRVLAQRTGFSPSFLSQLQRNQVSPSIGSLQKIAQSLGVTISAFFDAPEPPDAITRAAERHTLRSSWSKGRIEMVQNSLRDFPVDLVLITISAGGVSGTRPTPQPRTQVALIIRGEAVLTLSQSVYVMEFADSVVIRKGVGHRWENRSAQETQILLATARFADAP